MLFLNLPLLTVTGSDKVLGTRTIPAATACLYSYQIVSREVSDFLITFLSTLHSASSVIVNSQKLDWIEKHLSSAESNQIQSLIHDL